jgi:hypothetical protein
MNLVAVFYIGNKFKVGIMSTLKFVVAAGTLIAPEYVDKVWKVPCLLKAVGLRDILDDWRGLLPRL